MQRSILEVDAQRDRWVKCRAGKSAASVAADGLSLGGLAECLRRPQLRVLFLPADPLADVVPLNNETYEWAKQVVQGAHSGGSFGYRGRATTDAVVWYDQQRTDEGWSRYVSLSRAGGVELGSATVAHPTRDVTVFNLHTIVNLVWTAASLQQQAAAKWPALAPYELTVALPDTSGAALGGLAQGWANPGQDFDEYDACIDKDVLLRLEIQEAVEPEQIAEAVAERVDQAFGSLDRRYIARGGDSAGKFVVRF